MNWFACIWIVGIKLFSEVSLNAPSPSLRLFLFKFLNLQSAIVKNNGTNLRDYDNHSYYIIKTLKPLKNIP